MFKTTNPHRNEHGRGAWNDTGHPQKRERLLLFIITGAIWRWRWELSAVLAVAGIYRRLDTAGYSTAVIIVLLATALVVVFLVPQSRRFARNRFWCVIDRHRLRVCMNELRTYNYSGKGAFILTARATREGEAVWLWLRPGLSVLNLEQRLEAIAAACWARGARVHRSAKMAALIRVDILRRDPLAKAHIESPLLATTRHLPIGEVDPVRALQLIQGGAASELVATTNASVGAAHAPATTTTPNASKSAKASTKSTTSAAATAASPVISRTGEDVSDYV